MYDKSKSDRRKCLVKKQHQQLKGTKWMLLSFSLFSEKQPEDALQVHKKTEESQEWCVLLVYQ